MTTSNFTEIIGGRDLISYHVTIIERTLPKGYNENPDDINSIDYIVDEEIVAIWGAERAMEAYVKQLIKGMFPTLENSVGSWPCDRLYVVEDSDNSREIHINFNPRQNGDSYPARLFADLSTLTQKEF
ncbi:hypothetical protein HN777_00700 [Candidatus Woesearchaeota archaeon]|jgi:hypothetical protein|nr:hypothetical protein [Candidatus Woesearchaeota archaeon]MBT7402291.1 hypothetical protein [Candidatus Woesearchaeota archaeon]